ncbi:peptidoglycan DD-metalloendopeptidase family protein [Methylicorpusculum sp.]|uniref:peptidoglycan DD-metalloendopeptidase family protein n=1 Tax=Methylicorpusculum sp. TaxID=2713644 RepID=UPI00272F1739|nr:peptidoglycan DD-metalloendopeptidase family protein [Methylicorpusculum sp.]MDP2177783.1 peptidoglycan DD-metalloendopeptidase family protein [Methylicorpusculum sp.]MDP3530878.1 peptidoglycan DD-metalloendopeptidase family protein [Methylicorpusculum sp.]MDZ4150576.1 peptidoglycan DD-metalloendopeptidase family protein [Methylicorpusculum sp.]
MLIVFCSACAKNIFYEDSISVVPEESSETKEESGSELEEDSLPETSAFYTVRSGDNLYRIGLRFGVSYFQLAEWNHIQPPYLLHDGQRLKVLEVQSDPFENPFEEKQSFENKRRIASQKKPTFSTDNKKLLKLHWHWPITGMVVKDFKQSGKKGIDISGYIDQPVKAAESGTVVYSGKGPKGVGNLLIIKHDEIYMSAYANNKELLVSEGQEVEKAQFIAKVGMSRSGKPSLHFEIRQYGNPVDPLYYLPVN